MLLLSQLVQAEPVNINTADATALAKALNGIGPAKAKAIVSYRDKNGPFKSVDQLAMVEGITQKLIDKNRAGHQARRGQAACRGAGAAAPPNRRSRRRKPASHGRERCEVRANSRVLAPGRSLAEPGWRHGMVSAPR